MRTIKSLRDIRKAKGINQEELAEMVGISQVAISQYESGARSPSLEIAVKLAKVLGCTVEDLVEESNEET